MIPVEPLALPEAIIELPEISTFLPWFKPPLSAMLMAESAPGLVPLLESPNGSAIIRGLLMISIEQTTPQLNMQVPRSSNQQLSTEALAKPKSFGGFLDVL